jgi:hypothetical protein
MFNLKTDDILGARPRIRHAPRNLIRDQKLSQQNNDSYGNAPYNTDSYYHQYPYSKNDNQNHQAYLNYQ